MRQVCKNLPVTCSYIEKKNSELRDSGGLLKTKIPFLIKNTVQFKSVQESVHGIEPHIITPEEAIIPLSNNTIINICEEKKSVLYIIIRI